MKPKQAKEPKKVGRPRKTKATKRLKPVAVRQVGKAASAKAARATKTVKNLKAVARRPEKTTKITSGTCRELNFLAALLYFAQIVLVILFVDSGLYRSLDVTFLSENDLTGQLQTTLRSIYDIDLKHTLIVILATGGCLHLLFGFKAGDYAKTIKQKLNVWRWLVGGLMFGFIATVTAIVMGVADLTYLLMIFASMLTFGWLGLAAEYLHLHIDPGKSRSGAVEKKNSALRQVFGLIFSLKRVSGLFPWLMIGVSLVAGGMLASSTVGWQHSLIYFVGLLPILVWLINISHYCGFGPASDAKDYSKSETIYLASLLVSTSAWVWLVALLGA